MPFPKLSSEQPAWASPVSVAVHDDFLPENAVARLYEHFARLANPAPHGSFFLACEEVAGSGDVVERRLRPYFDAATDDLVVALRRLLEVLPPSRGDRPHTMVVAALSIAEPPPVVHFHLDWDFQSGGLGARLPIWSTVLHLGPSSGLVGGETWFCNEWPLPERLQRALHDHELGASDLRALSPSWIDVAQRQNRLVVFKGCIAHTVAPTSVIPAGLPRVTLVVNVWDHLPIDAKKLHDGLSVFSPEEYRVLSSIDGMELRSILSTIGALSPRERETLFRYLGSGNVH